MSSPWVNIKVRRVSYELTTVNIKFQRVSYELTTVQY